MVVEMIGGVLSQSLALLSDAFHMLTDVVGFGISITAIVFAGWAPNQRFTYGYRRAEALGCLASVMLTWILTAGLLFEALRRLMYPTDIDGRIMCLVAGIGLAGNTVMLYVLRGHEELHSHHGRQCSGHHGHSHSHHGHSHHDHDHENDHDHHCHEVVDLVPASTPVMQTLHKNLNMRAAMLHVVGDILQSVAVLISSIIIWCAPSAQVVDPMCTLLFCGIVMCTTIPVTKEVVIILMQGTPPDLSLDDINAEVKELNGVASVMTSNIWAISNHSNVLTMHVAVKTGHEASAVSHEVSIFCRDHFGIQNVTVQGHVVKSKPDHD
jgi:cation diffusion facilitator family transporter